MATNGRLITVYQNGTAIAGTRSNDLDHTADLIEKRTPNTGTAKEYTVGQKGWKVTTNYLVPANDSSSLRQVLNVGNAYTLLFGATGQTGSTKHGLQGTAILQQCRITATLGNLVQGAFVFQGTGELTQV